eukprot:COSAG05_NODE_16394_length_347_cov_0.697581_1_plen_102_part_10
MASFLRKLCPAGTYAQFSVNAAKTSQLTVGQVWGKQLLQVPSCSASSATVIQERFTTLASLVDAYDAIDDRYTAGAARPSQQAMQEKLTLVENLQTHAMSGT